MWQDVYGAERRPAGQAFHLRQGLLFPLTLLLIPGSQMAFPLPSSLTDASWFEEKMARSRPSGAQSRLF